MTFLGLGCPGHAEPPPPAAPAKPAQVQSLEEKLNRLILPEEPDYSGLTLEQAVEALREKSLEADTDESTSARGVNFVILSGGDVKLPAITVLRLRDVTLAEAVRGMTAQAGLKYRVDSHAVVIAEELPDPPLLPLTAADAPTDKEKRLLDKLAHSILPRVSLQNTLLREATEFLCLKFRPGFLGEEPPNLNIVLNLRAKTPPPSLTLNLREIPFAEVLRHMAESTGLELSLRSSAVVFSERGNSPPRPLLKREKPSETEVRASKIILPTVELWEAEFPEAVRSLAAKAREVDPATGVGIETEVGQSLISPITLNLKYVSLADALDHLATVSGLVLSCEEGRYIFKPRS